MYKETFFLSKAIKETNAEDILVLPFTYFHFDTQDMDHTSDENIPLSHWESIDNNLIYIGCYEAYSYVHPVMFAN